MSPVGPDTEVTRPCQQLGVLFLRDRGSPLEQAPESGLGGPHRCGRVHAPPGSVGRNEPRQRPPFQSVARASSISSPGALDEPPPPGKEGRPKEEFDLPGMGGCCSQCLEPENGDKIAWGPDVATMALKGLEASDGWAVFRAPHARVVSIVSLNAKSLPFEEVQSMRLVCK